MMTPDIKMNSKDRTSAKFIAVAKVVPWVQETPPIVTPTPFYTLFLFYCITSVVFWSLGIQYSWTGGPRIMKTPALEWVPLCSAWRSLWTRTELGGRKISLWDARRESRRVTRGEGEGHFSPLPPSLFCLLFKTVITMVVTMYLFLFFLLVPTKLKNMKIEKRPIRLHFSMIISLDLQGFINLFSLPKQTTNMRKMVNVSYGIYDIHGMFLFYISFIFLKNGGWSFRDPMTWRITG